MNQLSFLIYLADVSHTLGVFLGMTLAVGIVGSTLCAIVAGMMAIDHCEEESEAFLKVVRKAIPYLIAAAIGAALIPSKGTVYLMVASEMGEEVLLSPEMEKLRERINEYLENEQ